MDRIRQEKCVLVRIQSFFRFMRHFFLSNHWPDRSTAMPRFRSSQCPTCCRLILVPCVSCALGYATKCIGPLPGLRSLMSPRGSPTRTLCREVQSPMPTPGWGVPSARSPTCPRAAPVARAMLCVCAKVLTAWTPVAVAAAVAEDLPGLSCGRRLGCAPASRARGSICAAAAVWGGSDA